MNSPKLLLGAGAALAVVALAWYFGPRIEVPAYATDLPDVPADAAGLEAYVADRETGQPLRPNNGARVVWADPARNRTEYAFVYLHGFAGSYRDGFPVNVNMPAIFGANAYLARWAGHGLTAEAALRDFTPEAAWADARRALAIGRRLGRKVIILSTSTGGTLALKLAATFPDDVHALINIGPNVEDDQPGASVLMSPWGHELAMLASFGTNKKVSQKEPGAAQYFDTIYPSSALVNLQILVQTTMQDTTFAAVSCPVATVYYQKNYFQKDQHVEVSRYPEVHAAFATPAAEQRLLPLPTPETHFVASDIKSADWRTPQQVMVAFCTEVLGMVPLRPVDYVADASRFE